MIWVPQPPGGLKMRNFMTKIALQLFRLSHTVLFNILKNEKSLSCFQIYFYKYLFPYIQLTINSVTYLLLQLQNRPQPWQQEWFWQPSAYFFKTSSFTEHAAERWMHPDYGALYLSAWAITSTDSSILTTILILLTTVH